MSAHPTTTQRTAIVDWLRTQPDGATRAEIRAATGLHVQGCSMSDLVKQGRLRRETVTRDGAKQSVSVYRAVPESEDPGPAERKSAESRAGKVREWLRQHPEGAYVTDIAEAFGIDTAQAALTMLNLFNQGDVVRSMSERPGQRAQYFYRLSVLAGTPQAGQQWRTTPILKASSNRETLRVGPAPTPLARSEPQVVVDATPKPIANTNGFAIKATPVSKAIAPKATPVADSPRAPLPAVVPARAADAPRFALFSDGTLIMEGLPHLPDIVVIQREHAHALRQYLRGVEA